MVGPYVKQRALVSTHYTTVSMVRTIGAVLGLPGLGLNDGLALPMFDVFDLAQSKWDFTAVASDVLRTTKLPIDPGRFAVATTTARPLHDARYWAQAMKGQDFRSEDRLDSAAFNAALWRGLGSGPMPNVRSAELTPSLVEIGSPAAAGSPIGSTAGTSDTSTSSSPSAALSPATTSLPKPILTE